MWPRKKDTISITAGLVTQRTTGSIKSRLALVENTFERFRDMLLPPNILGRVDAPEKRLDNAPDITIRCICGTDLGFHQFTSTKENQLVIVVSPCIVCSTKKS